MEVSITVEYRGYQFTVESPENYTSTFAGLTKEEAAKAIMETAERAVNKLKRINDN
jgi:hypothetical protein